MNERFQSDVSKERVYIFNKNDGVSFLDKRK